VGGEVDIGARGWPAAVLEGAGAAQAVKAVRVRTSGAVTRRISGLPWVGEIGGAAL
jgi:hypothetical protein